MRPRGSAANPCRRRSMASSRARPSTRITRNGVSLDMASSLGVPPEAHWDLPGSDHTPVRSRHAAHPPRGVVRGSLAGAVGTLAMVVVWYTRYKRGGGGKRFRDWAFSSGLTWDDAPPPAQVGRTTPEVI